MSTTTPTREPVTGRTDSTDVSVAMNQFPYAASHLGDLRILTLNLNQRYGEWAARRAVLIAGIRSLQPDLAFAESIKNGEYDQVTDLLGSGFYVAHPQWYGYIRREPVAVRPGA